MTTGELVNNQKRLGGSYFCSMQKANPIGVFDSGIGGLTVVGALTRRLPRESILYFGDTARVPYGPKSPDTVRRSPDRTSTERA